MKKIYVTLCMSCMMVSAAFAQKGFHLGIEGAFNASFIVYQQAYGQSELDYAPTTGMAGGIVSGYNFDNHFGIQVEGLYSKQGQHYIKEAMDKPTVYRQTDLYYYHIPFLFKYNCGAMYPVRFFAMAGPQLSILDKASIYHKNDPAEGVEYTEDAKSRYVANTWDMVFEIGSDFTLYKGLYASAGLRFNYSMQDINAPDYRMPNHDGIYNASRNAIGGLNIGLHYVFGYDSK